MSRADSRIVVLTGATKGLGRAMTLKLIELGQTVIGCGRTRSAVEELQERYGRPHRFDVLDVSRDRDVARWARSAIAEHGPPDLLLNNAALINSNAPLWKVPAEEFSQVIDVNIKGVANVIRHFVPSMIERRTGVIVNFSSGWGRSTSPEVAPYCATKWAVEGLTQALAQELPAGVAAVPLNPGVINTAMLRSCLGRSAQHCPSPEDWANRAVPFLLELNEQHNGQPLTAPGG